MTTLTRERPNRKCSVDTERGTDLFDLDIQIVVLHGPNRDPLRLDVSNCSSGCCPETTAGPCGSTCVSQCYTDCSCTACCTSCASDCPPPNYCGTTRC